MSSISTTQRAKSKAIQQQTGPTFHLATKFLPERVRGSTYVLYAYVRVADEIVDTPGDRSPADQRADLDRLRAGALGEIEPGDEIVRGMDTLRREHDISATEIESFIDAMAMDIDHQGYRTHADLATYIRGSAVAVGHMMQSIMGGPNQVRARRHARALGEAFQLTNFIRDVREDLLEYDRIYLPKSVRRDHGVTTDDIRSLEPTPAVRGMIEAELERTERRYATGVEGIAYLPEDCQFPVLLSAVLYADHHRAIRARDFDVLSERPTVSRLHQIGLLVRTWVLWQRLGDPEAVFYRIYPFEASSASVSERLLGGVRSMGGGILTGEAK